MHEVHRPPHTLGGWAGGGLGLRGCVEVQPRGAAAYRDVRLAHVVLPALLGNEQHPLEEEERATVLGPLHMKGALQHQLPVGGQVGTLPVDQKGLDLLDMERRRDGGVGETR